MGGVLLIRGEPGLSETSVERLPRASRRRDASPPEHRPLFPRQNHGMRLTLAELDRPVGERFWFPFTYDEAVSAIM
jgi:hypothetical protein